MGRAILLCNYTKRIWVISTSNIGQETEMEGREMAGKKMKDELFSIPNILCYFRFLLIPIFCVVYLTASRQQDFYLAAFIVLIACITDVLDGFIARRFNMGTNLGKIIDPIADKLMQAAIAFCLSTRYPLMWVLIVIMVGKETFMTVSGILNLKSGVKVYSAMWFGKACTVVLFLSMLVLVTWPNLSPPVVDGLILINIVFMIFSLTMYALAFRKMRRELKNPK